MNQWMTYGGDGSHFPGCEESHWDCRIKKLEAENEQLTRQRDAARDGVGELTRMMMYRNELLDEKHAEIVKLRAEVERLREANDFHPRAAKLMAKRKNFVVVAVDESYFYSVYFMIRDNEVKKGTWTEDDERRYLAAIEEYSALRGGK
jgi:hypothetical protein